MKTTLQGNIRIGYWIQVTICPLIILWFSIFTIYLKSYSFFFNLIIIGAIPLYLSLKNWPFSINVNDNEILFSNKFIGAKKLSLDRLNSIKESASLFGNRFSGYHYEIMLLKFENGEQIIITENMYSNYLELKKHIYNYHKKAEST